MIISFISHSFRSNEAIVREELVNITRMKASIRTEVVRVEHAEVEL